MLIIGTILGVAAAFIALYRQGISNKKNLQMQALNIVFEKMNKEEHRRARAKVTTTYREYLKSKGLPLEYDVNNFKDHEICDIVKFDKTALSAVEIAKSDFSQIAVMIHYELLDANVFYDAFWATMLRCYVALQGNIEAMRDISGVKQYATKFQRQCEDRVMPYWREKHTNSTIKFYSLEEYYSNE